MERIAITGATGFVGRYVVKELLNRGYQVYALVRSVRKVREIFPEGVDALEVDFSDKDSLRKALEKAQPHYVIHLIGILVEDRRSGSTFQRVHYLYAKNLYETLRELSPKRVVHMSSLGTHRDAPSLYHQTKFMAEEFFEKVRAKAYYTETLPNPWSRAKALCGHVEHYQISAGGSLARRWWISLSAGGC